MFFVKLCRQNCILSTGRKGGEMYWKWYGVLYTLWFSIELFHLLKNSETVPISPLKADVCAVY